MTNQFNLGTLEISIEITPEGRVYPSIKITKDSLAEMFPINDLFRLEVSAEEYDDYVNRMLKLREKWIRENIPTGIYKVNVSLSSDNLTKEEE